MRNTRVIESRFRTFRKGQSQGRLFSLFNCLSLFIVAHLPTLDELARVVAEILDDLPPDTSMLASLPFALQILILGAIGLAIGVLINWAIYAWSFFEIRPISPWIKLPDQDPPEGKMSARKTLDYVPIIGWLGRARDKQVFGRGFWIRPMLIEIVWMIGLPWFYLWLAGGGLVDQALVPSWRDAETWFVLYTIFLGLMTIATFIDFDEKMIPDSVTVPGTLIALVVAALAPWSRLPEVVKGTLQTITHTYPDPPPAPSTWQELAIALGIFAIWIWALLPKISVWYYGWGTSIRFMYAFAFQPKRKTVCPLRTRTRSLPGITLFLCLLLLLGTIAIVTTWLCLPAVNWQSLYGSLQGLAFGGALIWSIRIVGTFALQQEAMGFGDVTLMAMIGATLGWQATLVSFVCTITVVIIGVIIQLIITRDPQIAFGPYLCMGAAITIFYWHALWPASARGVFQLGNLIWWILGASLALMAVMLLCLQALKGLFGLNQPAEE